MLRDIEDILKHCETCEKYTSTPLPAKSVIPRIDCKPYEQWAIDVIGPMPNNNQDKKYIITAVDFCTRWPLAQAVLAHNGNCICRFIVQVFKAKFGYPARILTDCGREFISHNTEAYLKGKDIMHLTTTPYHTQANSCVERLNGILLYAL